jgi:ribokinase
MDFVVRTERLPVSGETVLGGNFQMIPGGKGANQAFAASRLGAGSVDVRMIGRVGADVFADRLKTGLAGAGVDVGGVHESRFQPTGVALIAVDEMGRNQIVVASGANGELSPADVPAMRETFRAAEIVLFQLESPIVTVSAALRLASEEGVATMLDPAPAQTLPAGLYSSIDILTPNESEACALLGREAGQITADEAPEFAREIVKLGARIVVLKMGDRGCFFMGMGEAYHVPGVPVDAIDSTGAGDVFNAGLAVALAEGKPMRQALRFANAAAAVSVTRAGAQSSAPSRTEVDRMI